jgi:hypothetical protein
MIMQGKVKLEFSELGKRRGSEEPTEKLDRSRFDGEEMDTQERKLIVFGER